ncbi:alkene reductase [Mycolicibacterium duvalii]|uniref:Putative NADH-dependent flavin oxidoreductase n=1 Tax=Mycolicibacterium duvalii TaxID=39688 RepID=A0A7I7K866_9MYCO|nr:alkene reductase [Mycolicibacterium duvalii]MCV7366425.1 alkene reductase [Mycolicibacterium duvalii]PEG43783.1 alkene reductase [Mycolicibacterium duvalii]BBX20255.1 putative NADH-dependent flavin oxidoreductase [Mycolicibacterium duvalii]
MTFTLREDSALLKPTTVGALSLANRMFMAPLTRSRADADGTPSSLAPQYYAQRASAGLIISEATAVCEQANGAYMNTPGLYTDRQQDKWAEVAAAVHRAGGRMFVQLWHVGRMAHPDISGFEAVGPSPIAADLQTHTPTGKKPLPVPRALTVGEIEEIVGQFRSAARRAVDAGMDGVEIHSANGYLLHEFLSDVVNQRTDGYGGSPRNRARFVAEVIEAVVDEVGPDRVSLRISPGNTAGDMTEIDQISAYEALLCRIAPLGIAYLHVVSMPSAPAFAAVRTQWDGTLVLNTPRSAETDFAELEQLAEWGVVGAVAIGRAFLANPDLVRRLTIGAELNIPDVVTFYAPGPNGYTDYPMLDDLVTTQSA